MKLPKSWSDVTVGQYIEVIKSIQLDSNFETQLELLGVLADVPTEDLEDLELDEVLKSSDPTGKWIHDFVHSDNPKFAGKRS